MSSFNPPSIPKEWARQILEAEHDDGRFEQFANAVASVLKGRPIVGTSASWDLGRDGRGLGPAAGVYVLATLQADIEKPKSDATRLKEKAKPKRVYYVTARPHSEHTLATHASAIQAIVGGAVTVEPLGAIQIADLVAGGKATDAFTKVYAGEVASIHAALGGLGEREAHLHHLEFALATFGATNTQELRVALATRLILALIESGPATLDTLVGGAARLLGVEAFSRPTLQFYCDGLSARGLMELKSGQYRITEAGIAEQVRSRADVLASEVKGRSAVRAVVEDSLGRRLGDNWSAIWLSLQNELARAFYLRGKQLLDLISALLDGDTGRADRDVLGPIVDDIVKNVVQKNVAPPDRPIIQRALQDVFLPGDKHGAFDWLAGVAGRFAAVCTLGLPAEIVSSVREALRGIRFFFDTDVVISYLCAHEPAHTAARAVAELSRRLGAQTMVTDAIAEETARHAMKAHTDYRVRVAPIVRLLQWYELAELESAFTREFEYLRIEGKVRPHQWPAFIERYTGPEERGQGGRLRPNVGKMRQILSKDSFAIRTPRERDQRWEGQRDTLAERLFAQAKRQGETDLELAHHKARIDAEVLIAVAMTIDEGESRGTGERWILISSARRLRHLPSGVRRELPYVPEVLSLPEAACLAALLPDQAIPLGALHALLFEGRFEKTLGGLEAVLLRAVRQARSAVLPGATRGVLVEEFSSAILREARQTGEGKAGVRARISGDPLAFARVAAAALDALALQSPTEREEVLAQLENALRDRQTSPGQENHG